MAMTDHSIQLGIGTDLLQLCSPNGQGGFILVSPGITAGSIQTDSTTGISTRELRINLNIAQTTGTPDSALDLINKIEKYISQTRNIIEQYGGLPPLNSDESWPGAVLKIQLMNETDTTTWEIRDGGFDYPSTLTGPGLQQGAVGTSSQAGLSLRLVVNPLGKLARERGENKFVNGDFDRLDSLTNLPVGQLFNPNDSRWTLDTTKGRFGANSLLFTATSATTQDYAYIAKIPIATTDVYIARASVFVNAAITAGGFSIVLDYLDASSNKISTAQTLVLANSGTTNYTVGAWTDFTGAALGITPNTIPGGAVYIQITIKVLTGSINNKFWFGGLAFWRNPANNTAPNFYVSQYGNYQHDGGARFKVANVAGDVEAPVSLTISNTSGNNVQGVLLGGHIYDAKNDAPIQLTDLELGETSTGFASLVYDSFNRADNAASLGTADKGGAWSVQSGTWGISGNQAYCSTTAGTEIVLMPTSTNSQQDVIIEMDAMGTPFSSPSSWLAAVFRYLSTSEYLMVYVQSGLLNLTKVSGGAPTTLATGGGDIAWAAGTTYSFKIVAIGTYIEIFVNGVSKIQYTLTGGDTKYATTPYLGLGLRNIYSGSPTTIARCDYFKVSGAPAGQFDTFTRANSTSSLGTSDRGSGWITISGTMGILSNAAYNPNPTVFGAASIVAANMTRGASTQVTLNGSYGASNYSVPAVGFGAVTLGNMVWVKFQASKLQVLYGNPNGSSTVIAEASDTIGDGTAFVLRLEIVGSALLVYRDGTLKIVTMLDATATASLSSFVTLIALPTSGSPTTQLSFDNLLVQRLNNYYGFWRAVGQYLPWQGANSTTTQTQVGLDSTLSLPRDQEARPYRYFLWYAGNDKLKASNLSQVVGNDARNNIQLPPATLTGFKQPSQLDYNDWALAEIGDTITPSGDSAWSDYRLALAAANTYLKLNTWGTDWDSVNYYMGPNGNRPSRNNGLSNNNQAYMYLATASNSQLSGATLASMSRGEINVSITPQFQVSGSIWSEVVPVFKVGGGSQAVIGWGQTIGLDHWRVKLDWSDNTVKIQKVVFAPSGTDTVTTVASANQTVTANTAYAVNIKLFDSEIQVYINGVFKVAGSIPQSDSCINATAFGVASTGNDTANQSPNYDTQANNFNGYANYVTYVNWLTVGGLIAQPSSQYAYFDLGSPSQVAAFKLFGNDRLPAWGVFQTAAALAAPASNPPKSVKDYGSSAVGATTKNLEIVPSNSGQFVTEYTALVYRARGTAVATTNQAAIRINPADQLDWICEYTPRVRNVG